MTFKQLKSIFRSSLFCFAGFWIVLLSACRDDTENTDVGVVPLDIAYHKTAHHDQRAAVEINCTEDGIHKILAEVFDAADNSLARGGPWDCDKRTGTINTVLTGENRKVVLYGKDVHGSTLIRGEAVIPRVHSGHNDPVTVDCYDFIPGLQSPGKDAFAGSDSVLLEWTPVEGAHEYRVVVSDEVDLVDPVIDIWTNDVSYTLQSPDLSENAIYYWQVYAKDQHHVESKVSDKRLFISAIPSVKIPDTGQNSENTVEYGEDSDYTINPRSYTKLDENGIELDAKATEWTMIRDDVTGLIWEIKTDDDTIHDYYNKYNWQESQTAFIDELNRIESGGCTDWRLPTIQELSTLIDYGANYPAVSGKYIPYFTHGTHWTSSEYVFDPSVESPPGVHAWSVNFADGYTSADIVKADPETKLYAIAVCDNEQKHNQPNHFLDKGDGVVIDLKTGLMWQKEIDPSQKTWTEGLEYCEKTLDLGSYDDWRMPNINELKSIVDYESYPTINTTIFGQPPVDKSAKYWSSTAQEGTVKWYTDFSKGISYYSESAKTGSGAQTFYVRAVRGGQ